ncbi:MAG: EboA domain-containing protein [Planctomycetes bacterium]|nr:EboA domain-containing protein [Planctomycetota bacterium]
MVEAREFLIESLSRRMTPPQSAWLQRTAEQVRTSRDEPAQAFATLISLASRHVPRGAWAPNADERAQAGRIQIGFEPERWSLLDAARAVLVLSRSDLDTPGVVAALEECFRYADVGELVSLYRTLALLPGQERFAWRAGEGCRTSMGSVFEAVACDSALPVRVFDDRAWRQMVIKALFVEAPLWRVFGLDTRLDAELARMALDLADERRSAGRPVRHELWLCLGRHGGERGLAALEREISQASPLSRRAAGIALARAGATENLARHLSAERDPTVRATLERALAGRVDAAAFRDLNPTTTG